MRGPEVMTDIHRYPTFTTSILALSPTPLNGFQRVLPMNVPEVPASSSGYSQATQQTDGSSTVNGVVIGLLSSFGSAILIALIFIIVYFFKYTAGGRIILDRLGRPGEYDDEQAFLREEAEALEEMDDLQRTEYLRAKGRSLLTISICT